MTELDTAEVRTLFGIGGPWLGGTDLLFYLSEALDALDTVRANLEFADSNAALADMALRTLQEKVHHQERVIEIKDARLHEAIKIGEHLNKRTNLAEERIKTALEIHDGYTGACGDPDHCAPDRCSECDQYYPCDTRVTLTAD